MSVVHDPLIGVGLADRERARLGGVRSGFARGWQGPAVADSRVSRWLAQDGNTLCEALLDQVRNHRPCDKSCEQEDGQDNPHEDRQPNQETPERGLPWPFAITFVSIAHLELLSLRTKLPVTLYPPAPASQSSGYRL